MDYQCLSIGGIDARDELGPARLTSRDLRIIDHLKAEREILAYQRRAIVPLGV